MGRKKQTGGRSAPAKTYPHPDPDNPGVWIVNAQGDT